MNYSKSVRIALGVAALALLVAGSGHAFVGHENHLTFSRPVALPGVVLPAGAYSFSLVDASSSLDVVIVRNRERTKVYYMGFTNLVPRPRGMSRDTPVTFAEARAHEPRPIATWYEVGSAIGHEFLYR
jgi:hypothetical protein